MTLDHAHVEDVEHRICPSMKQAVTLPVLDATGQDTGICIYVATTAYSHGNPTDKHIVDIAKRLQIT